MNAVLCQLNLKLRYLTSKNAIDGHDRSDYEKTSFNCEIAVIRSGCQQLQNRFIAKLDMLILNKSFFSEIVLCNIKLLTE